MIEGQVAPDISSTMTNHTLNTNNNNNSDLKLQVATQYCSKGRQSWTNGEYNQALQQFRYALLILETLLGNTHVLVAQLYHWMGLIHQEQLQYDRAVQCLVRCLRIRYATTTSVQQESNTMEVQVALSNLWQAQGISSTKSFEMIHNLQEAVKIEQEADAILTSQGAEASSINYILVMKLYQKAMNVFPDAHHEFIMSKLATCYHKARGNHQQQQQATTFLDQAVLWYRMALKVFFTSCRFSEPSSISTTNIIADIANNNAITSHPEYVRIMQYLERVLHDYHTLTASAIQQYLFGGNMLKSILHQYAAEEALAVRTKTTSTNMVQSEKQSSFHINDLAKARKEYIEVIKIEQSTFENIHSNQSNPHIVIANIQKELNNIEKQYVFQLEAEREISQERLNLLENQSTDWIQTVRYQEDQLQKLEASLRSREGRATEALNAAASKEAELVGWKRKFETIQTEWKSSQKKFQSLQSEKDDLNHRLVQSQNKANQLEYTFKKQALDFQNFDETLQGKAKEIDNWKNRYQVAQQSQQHFQQKWERSQANERELQSQIKDLLSQNTVLKDWNKELQAEQNAQLQSRSANAAQQYMEQERKIKELQGKLQDVTTIRDRAIKKLRKLMQQKQQPGVITLEDKVKTFEEEKAKLNDAPQDKQSSLTQKPRKGTGSKPHSKKSDMGTENEAKVKALAARLEKSNDSLAALHAEHRAKLAELEELKNSKETVEGGVADAQEIIAMLKKANDERIQKCTQLQTENDRLHAKCNNGVNSDADVETNDMLIDQVADLELQNEDLKEKLDQTIGDNKKLAAAVKSLRAKIQETADSSSYETGDSIVTSSEAGAGNKQLLEKCLRLENELSQAKQKNLELVDELSIMTKQMKELTDSSCDESTGRGSVRERVLQTELKGAKEQIESLSSHFRTYKKQSESPSSIEEKQWLEEQLNVLEEQLRESSRTNKETSAALEEHKEKARYHEEGHENITKRCNELEKALDESATKYSTLSTEIDTMRARLASLLETEDENRMLKKKCSEREKELKSVSHSQHNQQQLEIKVSKLEMQLEETLDQKKKLLAEFNEYKEHMRSSSEAQEENIALLEKCSELEQQLQDVNGRNKELLETFRIEQQLLKDRCMELEGELLHAAEEYKILEEKKEPPNTVTQAQHQQLQDECAKLEKELKEAKDRNNNISSQAEQNSIGLAEMLAMESREQQRLLDQCKKLEKELEECKSKNQSLTNEVGILSEQTITLKNDLKFTESEKDHEVELKERCVELEQELERVKKERHHHELNGPSNELEKEYLETIEQNEKLEAKIRVYQRQLDPATNDSNREIMDRCSNLQSDLNDAQEQNEKLSEQIEDLRNKIKDLETYADDTAGDLEKAELVIAQLKSTAYGSEPGDSDFARLLERCTDLDAEKTTLKKNLKIAEEKLQIVEKKLVGVKKERDELQQEHDSTLSDLVDLQHSRRSLPTSNQEHASGELSERLDDLTSAKDELQKLLDEALRDNLAQIEQQEKLSESAKRAQRDRDELDLLYQQAKKEIADVKSELIAAQELLKEAKSESEEAARQLEIEKQISSSRKAALQADPEEENELEELYRQARDEMKELEEMLFEAEEQIEFLKTKNSKLEEKTGLSRHELIERELSSETVHSLEGLSKEELIKENRRVLHKLQEARTHAVDQQENITILQAQLRDALKFKERRATASANKPRIQVPNFWGMGKGRGKKKDDKEEKTSRDVYKETDDEKMEGENENS